MKCINLTMQMKPCRNKATRRVHRASGAVSNHCKRHFDFWYQPLWLASDLGDAIVKVEVI